MPGLFQSIACFNHTLQSAIKTGKSISNRMALFIQYFLKAIQHPGILQLTPRCC